MKEKGMAECTVCKRFVDYYNYISEKTEVHRHSPYSGYEFMSAHVEHKYICDNCLLKISRTIKATNE